MPQEQSYKVFKIEKPVNNPNYTPVVDKKIAVASYFNWIDVTNFIVHEYLCLSNKQKETVNSYWTQVIYPQNRNERKYVRFGLGRDRTKRGFHRFALIKGGKP